MMGDDAGCTLAVPGEVSGLLFAPSSRAAWRGCVDAYSLNDLFIHKGVMHNGVYIFVNKPLTRTAAAFLFRKVLTELRPAGDNLVHPQGGQTAG